MPIAMVLTLIPSFFIVAALLGSLDGATGPLFPIAVALALLAFVVIGLLRLARAMDSDRPDEDESADIEAPARHDRPSHDDDHDLPVAA